MSVEAVIIEMRCSCSDCSTPDSTHTIRHRERERQQVRKASIYRPLQVTSHELANQLAYALVLLPVEHKGTLALNYGATRRRSPSHHCTDFMTTSG